MKIIQNLVPTSKYSRKCPYAMNAEFIVVHNTANNASARNEIAYMISNNNQVSYHYAIDNTDIVQGIPENRNAWHAGDGAYGNGNRNGLAIEICYSKSGGKRFEDAEKLAAKFIAYKLKEKGWGIERVKKHQDFSGKYCPHRTLDIGWQRFLNMIQAELDGTADSAASVASSVYYPAFTNTSIVAGLKSIGVDSSFSYRRKIAKANGIILYAGTYKQNVNLLNLAKQGKLKKA